MASFLWWIIRFYRVVAVGDLRQQFGPRLYWLSLVFLVFDVVFALFCIVVVCLIGIGVCCSLPFIIAILYAVAGEEATSEADLSLPSKYKFKILNDDEQTRSGAGKMIPVETSSTLSMNERMLLPEDAGCCICLTSYEDGAELHALACNHHFHSACIAKWLKTNATCPLCKFNILKGSDEA